ncbi:MAG TPA: hypothetical protein VN606_08495 [Thermoleophilaceae bacterium]|nr:hypothetical protein [Thermoleophilaceae bacterium]
MKTKLRGAVVALIVLAAVPVTARASVLVGHSGWYWGNPLPQGNSIGSIDFAGGRGYAAGAFGTLLRTDDQGATWSGITTGIVNDLTTVDAVDANTVIIGGGCSARRSDDGGGTFHRLPFTPSELSCGSAVQGLSFASPTVGFLLLQDGTLLATADGGSSFSRKTAIPGTSAAGGGGVSAENIVFTSATNGFAVTHQPGNGKLYRTVDGGNTWNPVASGPFQAIWFADANAGYAVGDSNLLFTTVNGGANWTQQPLAGATPSTLRSINCVGATCLIGTAEGTRLIRTVDGGATGVDVSPSSRKVFAAAFASPTRAVAVGENGTTVVSNDAGATFSPVGGGIQGPFTRLSATSPAVAFATGAHGSLAKTTDSGQSWNDVGVPTSAEVIDASFPTPTTGFALDDAGSLRKTLNGGASWAVLNTGTSSEPEAVFAIDANRILLIGPRGLTRSANGGTSFARPPGRALSRAALDNVDGAPGAVFAYGSRALFISTNGGKTWAAVKRPSRDNLHIVDFVSSKRGWALDAAGRVWTTTNRGRHWTQLVATGTLSAYGMAFNAANRGYLLINSFGTQRGGFVLKTSDGGRTWHPQLLSSVPLADDGVATSTGQTDFAMDNSGRLFATASGGDQGLASSLKLTTKKKKVKRRSNITVSGKLNPAAGGEQVVVSARAQNRGWVHKVVQVASDGTFTTVWKLSRFTIFVAQWTGDADHEGAGSKVLQVSVK